jgi:glycosyltransferase involved in cell wall biosynthesis
VLNGLAVSLATSLHQPVISLLTGSDLDIFANPAQVDGLAAASHRSDKFLGSRLVKGLAVLGKRMLFARLIRLQRAGIAKCSLVDYAVPRLLPVSDKLLDEIGVDHEKRASFMLTDIETLPPSTAMSDDVFSIFCATRLQWKSAGTGFNASPLDNKGTDVMLEGLRRFVATFNHPAQIRLIAVGPDVEEAKSLVQDKGLASLVLWLPQLSQEEFLAEMAAADVVMENFGPDGGIGMAGRDAIAMGKPLVAWGKSDVFRQALGESLPIYEAKTPDQVCAQLKHIADNPEEVAWNSARARDFALRWFSARRAAERCVAIFEAARKCNFAR